MSDEWRCGNLVATESKDRQTIEISERKETPILFLSPADAMALATWIIERKRLQKETGPA